MHVYPLYPLFPLPNILIRGILFHWQQEKLRALQRLQRLEQRFSGPGVTEAEARNALRLFERELSKAVGWRVGWMDV